MSGSESIVWPTQVVWATTSHNAQMFQIDVTHVDKVCVTQVMSQQYYRDRFWNGALGLTQADDLVGGFRFGWIESI